MREFDVPFFDNKCTKFIEGYIYVPTGEVWTREDGEVFIGEMVSPIVDYINLAMEQAKYEHNLLTTIQQELAALDAAFLDAQYNMLIEGL